MTELIILAVGCLTLGMGLGILLTELLRVRELTRQILEMRKAGFLPNYSIQNEREYDPTNEVNEY